MSLKENVNREIAEKTAEFFFEGMSYEEAFEKAKETMVGIEKKKLKIKSYMVIKLLK